MKLKNIFQPLLMFTCAAVALCSCKKKLDTNLTNPNAVAVTGISGKDVFAGALVNTVNIVNVNSISYINQEWMGYWARTTSYSASGQQFRIETFSLNNADGDNFWDAAYHNIYDYDFVEKNSTSGSILPGASLTMKVLMFQDLADVFGNIPYSQAINPNDTAVSYDDASTIYTGLVSQIDSAMGLINKSAATSDDAADIMFQGDKSKWLSFANTIKLRLLLRQIPNISAASALQAEAASTAAYGYLSAGTDATINPGFADAVTQQSPFWGSYGFQVGGVNAYQNHTFYIACQTFIDYLNATSDPRLGYLFAKSPSGTYGGNYFGDGGSTLKLSSQLSPIGAGILKSASMPAVIMTASEGLFLQAEAAQRGLIPGTFMTLFNTAVAESFRFLGIDNSVSVAASFISTSTDDRVNPAVASDPIKTIIYQKWVANAEIDPLESWCDYRKTGYPDRTNPSINPSVSSNTVPKRFLYPQSEIDVNNTNYSSQHQIASDIYTKIFWAK